MIKGIGLAYGKRLVQVFAEAVFDVIEREPSRLEEIHGIGPKRAKRIVAGWADQKVIRAIPGQAAGGGRRPSEGAGARGQGEPDPAAVVEARGVTGRERTRRLAEETVAG